MVCAADHDAQVILATQLITLVNQFDPVGVLVVKVIRPSSAGWTMQR